MGERVGQRPWLSRLFVVIVLIAAGACAAPEPSGAPATSSPEAASSASPAPFKVEIVSAKYGSVVLNTEPGADCRVDLAFPAFRYGEEPPRSASVVADALGVARVELSAPRIPAVRLPLTASCSSGSRTTTTRVELDVEQRAISAARFSVRLTAGPPRDQPAAEEPALTDLRDRAVAELRRSLPVEWSAATRALGALTFADAGADISVSVVARAGTSVHRRAPDASEDIVVYVADEDGPIAVDNIVAVTLHELGHIWCCFGDGTTDGHWTTQEKSPGMYGVDQYGLMNHPVHCLVLSGGALSCPNRFSDRELRSMGFDHPPAPPPSECADATALQQRWNNLDAQVRARAGEIERQKARAAQLEAQIRAIEAQYPNGVPEPTYSRYGAPVSEYNSVVSTVSAAVDQHNALAAEANGVRARLLALQYCF